MVLGDPANTVLQPKAQDNYDKLQWEKLALVCIAMCCLGYYLSLQSQQKHCVVVNLVVTNQRLII